jgi:hypothetical protein
LPVPSASLPGKTPLRPRQSNEPTSPSRRLKACSKWRPDALRERFQNAGRLLAAKHHSGDLHFRIDQPDRTFRRTLHTSPRRIFESSHCGIRRFNNPVSGPTLATGDACVTENVAQRWVRWNACLYHSYNLSKTAPSTAPLSTFTHFSSEPRCCIAISNTSSSEPRTTRILVSNIACSPGDSAAWGSTC